MTRFALAARFSLAAWLALSWRMMVHSAPTAFLSRLDSSLMDGLSVTEARALAEEIESLFGEGLAHGRFDRLEDALRPMYASLLPVGSNGLGHAATRYFLSRYFQQRHGWLISGLDPEGGAWNSSSPAAILEGRTPAYLQQTFEGRLAAGRMDLHALAVMIVTFEQLVRIETAALLEESYRVLEIPPEALLQARDLDKLLQMNMLASYFRGESGYGAQEMRMVAANPQAYFPGWSDTALFLQDARMGVAHADRAQTNPFIPQQYTFGDVMHIVMESNDVYGRFQDQECQHLRNLLLPHEDSGTGRVRLSLFHGLARSGHPEFAERAEYLRDIGTLDESEPGNPKVLIANWLVTANCLGRSAYYNYCCHNECNDLMSHLEHELAAPRADPDRLASVVAHLSSSTVAAPRNLSTVMLERLRQIGAMHGGPVPLHGRLFAEWLHYAFPRECPYPHRAGAYRISSLDTWEQASGMPATLNASEYEVFGEDLDSIVSEHGAMHEKELDWEHAVMDALKERSIQWADDEDTLVPWTPDEKLALSVGAVVPSLRTLAMASAALGAGVVLVQQLSSVKGPAGWSSPDKYVV